MSIDKYVNNPVFKYLIRYRYFLIRRIILKTKGAFPPEIKSAIKAIGGYWDDLFDGYSLPMESSIHIARLMDEISVAYEAKEFNLPKEHVNQKAGERYMYGKYATLTKKLIHDEMRLMKEILEHEKNTQRFSGIGENGSQIKDLPWSFSMYEDEPKSEGRLYSAYLIEKQFHERLLELKKLRKELAQIDAELKAFESLKKA